MIKRNCGIAFCFSLLLAATAGAATDEKIRLPVDKFQLSNGLTVLVHEDHTVPILSYQQWFRVGSSYEKPGRTGLAHFFEHLMFKGTKKYPKGEIERIIQINGGSNNAFTTEDYTGYYTNLPSDKLELIVDVESDRMRNLNFDETEINSEREVVKEERRMRYENSVFGSLLEQVRQTLYKTAPYHWPVIGYMADLNATKIDELKDFYNHYYAPNNAVVVVAGDVTPGQVKKLVEKYYGPIARQDLPAFQPTPEAEQMAPRTSKLTKEVQGVTTAVVYPGVPAGNGDAYALDLLTSALGAGTSSRLYKRVVYKGQLATDISMSSTNKKLNGDVSIYISFRPGAKVDRGLRLVNTEIADVQKNLISDLELTKLKNQVMLGYVKGLETMASRAQSLALNEIFFSDYRKLFEDLDKYQAVTKEDIQRVANKYIVAAKSNLVQLVPGASGVTR